MPGLAIAAKDPWVQEKQNRLKRWTELYRTVRERRDALDAISNGVDPRRDAYSADELANFKKMVVSADQLIDGILIRHGSCKKEVGDAMLSACAMDASMLAQTQALASLPLIGPPNAHFELAYGVRPDDPALGNRWRFADAYSLESIFTMTVDTQSAVDYGPSPSAWREQFFKAIPREIDGAAFATLAVAVDSEHLDTVVFKFIADEASFASGFVEKEPLLAEYKAADLSDDKHSLSQFVDWNAPSTVPAGLVRHMFSLDTDVAGDRPWPPPQCVGQLPGKLTAECKEYAGRYSDWHLLSGFDNYPWIYLAAVVKTWITTGGAHSGKGRLIVRATDRYGGQTELTILPFAWDTDEMLHIARVAYGVGQGSFQRVWYLANLGSVSTHFPRLVLTHEWSGAAERDGHSYSDEIPLIKDKWSELYIKYCPSSIDLIEGDRALLSRWTSNPRVEIAPDRKSARGRFDVAPMGLGRPHLPYRYRITTNAVVKVKERGVFAPDFFADDVGCR